MQLISHKTAAHNTRHAH